MTSRSRLDICLPLVVFAVLCLSVPTMVVAFVWTTIGMITIGHRAFDSFPDVAPDARWRTGYRVAILHFYHLAWWPWYKRFSLLRFVRRLRRLSGKSSRVATRNAAARGSNREPRTVHESGKKDR